MVLLWHLFFLVPIGTFIFKSAYKVLMLGFVTGGFISELQSVLWSDLGRNLITDSYRGRVSI